MFKANPTQPQNLPEGVVCKVEQFPEIYCVYEHSTFIDDATGIRPILWGTCKLRDVYNMVDSRRNSAWTKRVSPHTDLYVKVLTTGDMLDCQRELMTMLQTQQRPICNAQGFHSSNHRRPVVCSNGVTYASQKAAADATGVPQGQISKLVRGLPGHHTANGLTFRYE